MKPAFLRLLSLLLVIALCVSMVPAAYAAEKETQPTSEAETEPITEPVTEVPNSTEESIPHETSPPTEETTPQDAEMDSYGIATASEDYGIMPISGNKLTGVTLLNLASPYNYTLQLPSQVYVKYIPAGTSTAKTAGLKNIGWHYYSHNGVADKDRPIYCIEPLKDFNAGSPGNYMDQGVDVWGSNSTGSIGSNSWYALSSSQRSAIALILQYSELRWDDSYSVTTTARTNNPNFGLRNATQVLIYEIVTGLRNPSSFVRNDSNGYTDGSVLYDAFKDQISDFRSHYNGLVSDVQGAMLLPSFCSSSSSSAPTITLATDSVLTWVADDNGVLQNFTFPGDDDIYFNVYNELCIEHYGNLSGTRLYSCYRSVPSTSSSSFNVFYGSSSSYQTCVALNASGTSTLTGYFKLYAAPQTGNLNITKTTSNSQNLSGWQFGVYANSACTSLVAGPYTTNSSGKISISGLSAGTYYVKEIGNTNSTVAAMYTCTSTTPRSVTISAGSTSSVSFANALKPGSLNIKKVTSDGRNLSGWQFSIYSNAACTTLVSGPHTSNSSGAISVSNLPAGTYYVKEVGHTDSSIAAKYSCSSTNPQAVTISPGGTASVSFTNTLKLGSIQIIKTTNTGSNLSGWKFGVYTDSACASQISGSPFTSGSDGKVTVSNLNPGTYYVKEVSTGDSYWVCDTSVKTMTVTANQTASATFVNTQYGRIAVQKSTNTGSHLSGWTFQICNADGDTVAEIVTDDNGYAVTGNLPLGRYTVREMPIDDEYWQANLNAHDVTVKAGQTVTDEWRNVEQGLVWIYKKTNTGDSVAGWEITLYSDEACTQEVATLVTNEDGKAGIYLAPGIYYAAETGDTEGRFENEYWLVDETVQKVEVKPHEDTSVTFTNIQYGKLKVIKRMDSEGSVADWKFKITDAEGKEITGSPFTTSADGTILTGNLLPGKYTVEELIPKDSPYICVSENPQTVTVVQGEVAEVTFTNAMVPAKIIVTKVDIGNNPLSGAKFLLEWSEDGSSWEKVVYSTEKEPIKGGCNNPNAADGCLISGPDGILEWGSLHPGVQYRLTELEAPEGYVLLEDYAYEGTIPTSDYTLELRVVNGHGFTLPDTGADSMLLVQLFALLAYAVLMTLSIWNIRRKELR